MDEIRAFAKINLYLRVHGRRSDGYHYITNIMHLVSLHDTLEVSPSEGFHLDLHLEPNLPNAESIPRDSSNSVLAAMIALGWAGARAVLKKGIPPGAGLGGESTDAAAALRLGAAHQRVPEQRLRTLAARLGSDVSFFLTGYPAALISGTGEEVEPVPPFPDIPLVVAMPHQGLATARVYRQFDTMGQGKAPPPYAVLEAMALRDLSRLVRAIYNDLQAPAEALLPEIRLVRSAMVQCGALGAWVTGSGAGVFGIAASPAEAEAIRRKLAKEPYVGWCCVCRSIA
ncbi:MAG: 4-(cytidine 5'-diphospho)-2-C-methyl-D-erythritol kinase [Bacillota bacterium]